MGGACGTHNGNVKCIETFRQKPDYKDCMGDIGVYQR